MTTKTTTRSDLKTKEKFRKDPEMARCFSKSESQPLMNGLTANAEAFIKRFDSSHANMKRNLLNCQFHSINLNQLRCISLGFISGGLVVFILVCCAAAMFVQKQYFELFLVIGSLLLLPIVFVTGNRYLYRLGLDNVNSNVRDFRKTVFWLIIELGKLKQRCEDLKGSLGLGIEKDNLTRVEESIWDLLRAMEKLTDTATPRTVPEVQKEYVDIFNQLEKMKVRLSFYSEASDRKNDIQDLKDHRKNK